MDKKRFHFYYGIVLTLVGIGVFYRIPQVMPQVETIEFFRQKIGVVKASFYILGGLLVMFGVIRMYKNFK